MCFERSLIEICSLHFRAKVDHEMAMQIRNEFKVGPGGGRVEMIGERDGERNDGELKKQDRTIRGKVCFFIPLLVY